MNQGTQGYSLINEKTEGRKSRETVPLNHLKSHLKVIDFWAIHYKRVDILFNNMDIMGIKRCSILLRFQKHKLHLWMNSPKKLFQNNRPFSMKSGKSAKITRLFGITFFCVFLQWQDENYTIYLRLYVF
jgi:hypothetical protein